MLAWASLGCCCCCCLLQFCWFLQYFLLFAAVQTGLGLSGLLLLLLLLPFGLVWAGLGCAGLRLLPFAGICAGLGWSGLLLLPLAVVQASLVDSCFIDAFREDPIRITSWQIAKCKKHS